MIAFTPRRFQQQQQPSKGGDISIPYFTYDAVPPNPDGDYSVPFFQYDEPPKRKRKDGG